MPEKPSETAPRWVKRLAIVSGLLGFVLFVLTPFMPVNQTQSSFSWPQQNQLNSITAPLISYAPQSIEASIPLQSLQDMNPDQSMVLSTLPADSKDATTRGLFVRYSESRANQRPATRRCAADFLHRRIHRREHPRRTG